MSLLSHNATGHLGFFICDLCAWRLHPQYPFQVFFTNIPGAVTLLAASEQLANVSFVRALKHQLIAPASTGVTGLALHVSTNGSDLAFLLLHELPLPALDLSHIVACNAIRAI